MELSYFGQHVTEMHTYLFYVDDYKCICCSRTTTVLGYISMMYLIINENRT